MGSISVEALSRVVAAPLGSASSPVVDPSKAVPWPSSGVIPPMPVELIDTTLPSGSKAKLSGASMSLKSVVQVESFSSAMKASLKLLPT